MSRKPRRGRPPLFVGAGQQLGLLAPDEAGNAQSIPFADVLAAIGGVQGPGSSVDNALVRFNGTAGVLIAQGTVPAKLEDDGRITGVVDPTGLQDVATKNYVDERLADVGIGGAAQNTFLVSGGQVVWQSAYTFLVSAATYYIAGVLYSSAQQSIALDSADPTDGRIDIIAVDDTGTVVKITGTPAAQPSEPDVDPGSQLKLAIVLVEAGSTSPTVSSTLLYAEQIGAPTEWDWSSSGAGWALGSLTNPRGGTKAIEATNVSSGAYVQGQIGSGTFDPATVEQLVIYIRSKATWANNRTMVITLRNAGVQVGQAVAIAHGQFGFDSSQIAGYQQIAIPMPQFAIASGALITQVRLTRAGSSTLGFYLDDLAFIQGGNTPVVNGITQAQADARYLQLAAAAAALQVRTADPAAPTNGEAWLFDDGASPPTLSLKWRRGGVTYAFPIGTAV